ncbi:hypothetical protein TRICI_001176 [Trichomonascus ciferrii]|uniref:Transcription factor domain-containing protein n=1 Tax=Trichomonascus ciferrii TaxID=44093 RepID=A0A642VA15_9ASCO|nr:hypothetical protein TRICI_001176 [Trichomonascus ciferrii]
MTEFVFIPLDTGNPTKPIDVAAEEYPVLTLAMIVACATTTSVDHAEELNSFISRVYSERILINEDPSVEMVKALMVTCSYLKPRPHPKSPILLLYMLSFLFQLGHANDAKVLLANTADPVELELVRDRCRVYLGIYCMTVSFTLTMQRSDMFRFLGGSCEVTCQGLLKSGHSVDVKLVHFARLLAVGKEAFDFITTSELGNHPFPMVKAKVEHYRDKLQEAADMFNIDEDTKSSELFTNIATTYHNHILLVVYEHALTELVLKYDDSKQRKLMDFGYEVVGIAQKIVDLFASLTNGDTLLFPKMVYYRPLQAIVAIIRVQVIMWSKHLEAQVDIQRTFDKVKKAWDRAKIGSYTGVEMYKLLLKVEKWVSLTQNPERLGEDREIVLKENASRILKGVLFDVLSNKSGGKSGGSEPMTTAASTTSSYSANATQETTAESQVSWKDVSASMDTGGNLVQSMPSVLQQEEAVENQVQSLFDGNSNIDNFSSFNEFDPPMLNTAQMEVLLKELFTEY